MEANILNAIYSIYDPIFDLKKYPVKFLCGLLQPKDAISRVPPVGFFFFAFLK